MPNYQFMDRYRGVLGQQQDQNQGQTMALQSMLNQQQPLLEQPTMSTLGNAPQMAQENAMAQQQPPLTMQRPAPRPVPRTQTVPTYQRVQQNAQAIQQAQARRPLGAGAGAAAASQGIRSPSAPGGQIGSAPQRQLGAGASAAAQGVRSPAAPINQIQRTTMARI